MSNYLASPSTRAQVITRRTYNRPTDESGQVFESWTDTVERVMSHQRWLWERAKESPLDDHEVLELGVLRDLMITRKVSTSGRTLWLGGTDLSKKREASQFNPLPLSTKAITNVGVLSFEDMNDGDKFRVLTHTGRWQDAVFMNAGLREMRRLHLRRVRSTAIQDTSANHIWLLRDGSRVKASDLKIGDQLHRAPVASFYDWQFDNAEADEQLWWCYGFVYGDGAMAKSGNSVTSRVRLCGAKAEHLSKFQACGFGFSYPPSCGGDPFVWTGAYQKTLPNSETDDDRLIKAFLRGYLDADGHKKDQRGQTIITGLATTSDEAADFVCRWLPMFGVYVLRDEQVQRKTNYGEFIGRELSFTTFGSSGGHLWTVEGIEQIEPKLCACLTVEEDHSFVLPNGIVTGNCSFLRVETVSDIADAFWLLLQGCGVGFEPIPGILNGFANPMELEIIPSTRTSKGGAEYNKESVKKGIWTIKVGDSAEAWSKVPAKILANKCNAKKLILDFSELRPAGERLKGYGWISSGYTGLAKAMTKIVAIMNRRAGDLLTRIDILDIMNWLGTTLSSRRSAEIAVVPWGDPEAEPFAIAKRNWWEGNEQRAQSNNSLMFGKRPTKYELYYVFGLMEKGGGSEPGFLNAEEAYRRAPWFKGVNPCLTGDTLVPIQNEGLRRIGDIQDEHHDIRDGNGEVVSAEFKRTEDFATILSVELSDGSIYRTTPTHEFVMEDGTKRRVDELTSGDSLKVSNVEGWFGEINRPKDAYLDAWLIADGTWHNNHGSSKLYLYPPKHHRQSELEQAGAVFTGESQAGAKLAFFPRRKTVKGQVPDYILRGNKETMWSFIRGFTQSDGHVGQTEKGWLIQYTQVHRSLLQELQAMLRLFGVRSKLSLGKEAHQSELPNGKGGTALYDCQPIWRLTVSNPAQFFVHYDPSVNKRGPYKVKERITVVSVIDNGEIEPVFCAGVSTTASFDLANVHSGNCAEILLGNKSFCNLVEVDLGKFNGNFPGLLDAIRLVARANYRQTCVNLNDEVLQKSWHELNNFLRLCGVGLTGIVRWEFDGNKGAAQKLAVAAREGAWGMADELGLPRPKAVTTIKPSGTLSKIMDTTEGVHKPLGRYILNNVNFNRLDPIIQKLRDANYKVIDNPTEPDAVLVTFPVAYEDVQFDIVDGKHVNLESAVSQLERYKFWMDNYVDHNCSITISYSKDEVDDIVAWLDENWSHYVGVSFIYRNDPTKTAADLGYLYLPQEVVTEEVYSEYASKLLLIDLDTANSFDELIGDDCATGACPIK